MAAPRDLSTDTVYVGLEHIDKGGRLARTSTLGESEVSSTKVQFTPEHVLVGKLRPNLGKIATVEAHGVASTDILPLLPGSHLDQRYLLQFLRQRRVVDHLTSLATGANLPRLAPKSLLATALPVPPMEEQRRIAGILDRVDGLRTKRRDSIARLDDLVQSVYSDAFVAQAAADWEPLTVADLAAPGKNSVRTGPFGSQLLKEEFTERGVAVIGIDNTAGNSFVWGERRYISEAKYRQLERYTVAPGDVLITIMGTNGRVAIVPEDIPLAINTKHLCCITLDHSRCLPDFLRATFLWNPDARKYLDATTKGAIMGGLNMGIIKALPVHLPPIGVQREFAQRARAIEGQKERYRAQLAELDRLFASLQARAFHGEL
jgi:type I restriction enzyme, S subunit